VSKHLDSDEHSHSDSTCPPNGGSTTKERLAKYGLTEADAFPDNVVVPTGKKLRLSAQGLKQLPRGYATIVPKSMEEVKKWIGVPESSGAAVERSRPPLRIDRVPFVTSQDEFDKLGGGDKKILRDIAYRYVYGDASIYNQYLPAINNLLTHSALNGVFILLDVDVLPGSVLEIAADVGVFFAADIRIWAGGVISLVGGTSINCISIVGNYKNPISPVLSGAVANLGSLLTA